MRVLRGVSSIWLAALVPVSPASGQDETGADRIRALRAASNEAIARRDVAAIVSFVDREFRITTGSGAFLDGPEAMAAAFAEQFGRYDDVLYVRTPESVEVGGPQSVEVGTPASTAYETGTWVGTWTTPEGPLRTGGRYSAYWRRVDGNWKIHAELFVTLYCDGDGCIQRPSARAATAPRSPSNARSARPTPRAQMPR